MGFKIMKQSNRKYVFWQYLTRQNMTIIKKKFKKTNKINKKRRFYRKGQKNNFK